MHLDVDGALVAKQHFGLIFRRIIQNDQWLDSDRTVVIKNDAEPPGAVLGYDDKFQSAFMRHQARPRSTAGKCTSADNAIIWQPPGRGVAGRIGPGVRPVRDEHAPGKEASDFLRRQEI